MTKFIIETVESQYLESFTIGSDDESESINQYFFLTDDPTQACLFQEVADAILARMIVKLEYPKARIIEYTIKETFTPIKL